MTHETFVFDRSLGKCVPADEFYRRKWAGTAISDLPRPMIISDSLDHVLNMADGKRYSSKAAYYKAVRRSGCEIVGNESGAPTSGPKTLDDPINDIRVAVEQVSSRAPKRRGKRTHG